MKEQECRFYYAKVIEDKYGDRYVVEPVNKGWSGEREYGKEPEWCCEQLHEQVQAFSSDYAKICLEISPGRNEIPPFLAPRLLGGGSPLASNAFKYCPYCAARIVWEKNLTLRFALKTVQQEVQKRIYEVVQ